MKNKDHLLHYFSKDKKSTQSIREYYQRIISCMPNNVYWLDRNCITQGCNDNVLKLVGLKSLDEFIGITYEEMGRLAGWTEGQAESFKHDDMEVMDSGIAKINIEEPPLYDAEGNPVYYMSSRVPIFDEKNEVVGVVGISVDITERKKNEQALKEALIKAEAANQAKSAFLTNLSHDIKTPLTGIISTAEYLTQTIENKEHKKRIDNIFKSGLRLYDFIVELIEVSNFAHKASRNKKSRFNLNNMLNDLIELIKPAIDSKSLKLSVHYDKQIPDFLLGDRADLNRILLNLLSNAIKFTNQGEIAIEIDLASKTRKNVILRVSVKDTGIGIHPDKQQVIFEQFTRLTPAYEGNYEGHGLGLYIVKEFISKMGGEVSLISEVGKGSQFICVIPLKIASSETNSQELVEGENDRLQKKISVIRYSPTSSMPFFQASQEAETNLHGSISILLVEDDEIAAQAASDILKSCDCRIDRVNTGEKAITQFKNDKYDIVLVDLGLPDINGLEVIRKIRELEQVWEKKAFIAALSAHINHDIKLACIEMGVDSVLNKPLLSTQAQDIADQFNRKKNTKPPQNPAIIDLQLGADVINATVDDAKKMLDLFMKELPIAKQEIEQAYKDKDISKLQREIHKMHGGLCYCGAPRLKHIAKKLEKALQSGNPQKFSKLYGEFNIELAAFVDEYKKL